MPKKVKITIMGTGFVGLVTAAVFADRGFKVTALDIDKKKVDSVNKGEPFFYEPYLADLLARVALEKKTLQASTNLFEKIRASTLTFICVGTPSRDDGSCDLSYIEQSARDIGRALKEKKDYHVIVVKSTVVPGTTRSIVLKAIEEESGKVAGQDFGLCMNPEFLREGQSVFDSLFPDRIVIGKLDERSGRILEEQLRLLYKKEESSFSSNWQNIFGKQITIPEILRVSLESAECIKYANNSFLATKISFINEFANICERIPGVDVVEVAKGIGLDSRINPRFLGAGAGFGGSCFPKDVQAISKFAKEKGYKPVLLEGVMEINNKQAKRMVELTEARIGSLQDKKIAILGLSFKPETSDMRHSPSIQIIKSLVAKGARVTAWDPKAIEEAKIVLSGTEISYGESLEKTIAEADACLIVTDWQDFKKLRPLDFMQMKKPVIIDGRRIYDYKEFIREGIEYSAIGLGQ